MAIKGEHIIFVGDNEAVSNYIGTTTSVEDFNGQLILPGFHDVIL